MKKNTKLLPYFLFTFCIILNSCSSDNLSEETEIKDFQKSVGEEQRIFYDYTDEDFSKLGNVHNELLTTIQNNLEVDVLIDQQMLNEVFISHYSDIDLGDDYTVNQLWDYSVAIHDKMESNDYYIKNWQDNPFSAIENIHIDHILLQIDYMDQNSKSYSWFQNQMMIVHSEIISNSEISKIEREGLLGVIAVAEKSVLYWAPIDLGGLGNYDKYNPSNAKKKGYWSRAGRADAAVSAGFMLSSSVLFAAAITAPPAGLGFLVAWGVSAGIGSALGGFIKNS